MESGAGIESDRGNERRVRLEKWKQEARAGRGKSREEKLPLAAPRA
jgi:hypothetical protein